MKKKHNKRNQIKCLDLKLKDTGTDSYMFPHILFSLCDLDTRVL